MVEGEACCASSRAGVDIASAQNSNRRGERLRITNIVSVQCVEREKKQEEISARKRR
jgi:hypothetical protein